MKRFRKLLCRLLGHKPWYIYGRSYTYITGPGCDWTKNKPINFWFCLRCGEKLEEQ